MIDRYEQIGRQCKGTPDITVFDVCGNVARQVQSNRVLPDDPVEIRITRNTWSMQDFLTTAIDPRLFDLQQDDSTVQPNVSSVTDLDGRALRAASIDAGIRTMLWDVAGNPVQQFFNDDASTRSRFEYDTLARPTAAYQNDSGGVERTRERWCYGEGETDQTAARANNQIGRCVRHYDTAGRLAFSAYTLAGKPLGETRQLVKDRSQGTDWQGADDTAWAALLDPQAYATAYTYNTLGDTLTLTDAAGNLHAHAYNVAGQLTAIDLTQKDKTAVKVISDIRYDANGLRLADQLGNGMSNAHSYDPSTLRLIASQTLRPEKEGRDPMLQDLYYDYDPVGNIIATYNYALNDSVNDNAGMLGKSDFYYDACYELSSASGRENGSSQQSSQLPAPIVPVISDPTQMSPYVRTYSYDKAGNLLTVQHQGATPFTQEFVVASRSNRSVMQRTDTPIQPADVDAKFDKQGNPAALNTGATLAWNRYNQLAMVTTVTRTDGNINDTESYLYDGNSQRVYKESKTLQSTDSGSVNTVQTLYLPGLTVRRTTYGSTVNEELHTLTVEAASDQDIRVLHWETGLPADIANDQYRYSINNQIHANLIELDASADIITLEEYYPFGGTAVWSTRSTSEAQYKYLRYSGKERDTTGLYYFGFRYYIPWMGRWTNPDPAGFSDGLNVYEMTRDNPTSYFDPDGHHSASYSANSEHFLWAFMLTPAFIQPGTSTGEVGPRPDNPPQPVAEAVNATVVDASQSDSIFSLMDATIDESNTDTDFLPKSVVDDFLDRAAGYSPEPAPTSFPKGHFTRTAKGIGKSIKTERTAFFSLYKNGGATYAEHNTFISLLDEKFQQAGELISLKPKRTGTIMSEALGVKGMTSQKSALQFIEMTRNQFSLFKANIPEEDDPSHRFQLSIFKETKGKIWKSNKFTYSQNTLMRHPARSSLKAKWSPHW